MLHFKKCFEKYFLLFDCVLENIIENTFFTCCSHFLSCQTNINIIPQYRNTKETKPRKKNSSNSVKLREEGRERGDWVRSRGRCEGEIEQRWSRSLLDQRGGCEGEGKTDAIWCDRRGAAIDETGGVGVVELELDLWSSDWSSV